MIIMAQVSNVDIVDQGEDSFAVTFSGTTPTNEFMQIQIFGGTTSTSVIANFKYVPAEARDHSNPYQLFLIFEYRDYVYTMERNAMLDASPGLKDQVRMFINSAKKMALAYGNSGGEEMQDTGTFPLEFRKRCIQMMDSFPLNEEAMRNVFSKQTGSDEPWHTWTNGAFGGPVATLSSTSYTDWTTL